MTRLGLMDSNYNHGVNCRKLIYLSCSIMGSAHVISQVNKVLRGLEDVYASVQVMKDFREKLAIETVGLKRIESCLLTK